MQCSKHTLRAVHGIEWLITNTGNRMSSCFVPRFRDGKLYLPRRGNLPLRLKVGGVSFNKRVKKGFLRPSAQADFAVLLMTSLGVSRKAAKVIASRSIATLHRIEEEIMGLIDAFLLCDASLFIDYKQFNHLIRICYCIGATDLDQVTRYWKQFTNFIWVKASETQTLEEPIISIGNPFRRYLPLFQKFIPMTSKCQAEQLIHLVSSRQLVAGSAKSEKKSLEKFIKTTSNEFPVSDDELRRIHRTAKQVGRKVLALLDGKLPDSSAHISLSAAGDYEVTVKEGGRCHKIVDHIRPILTRVAEEDREYLGPSGILLREERGIPVWRTWCRSQRLECPYEFGEIMEGNPKYWNDDRRAGFDEAIGFQIFVCALMAYEDFITSSEEPIPCRVITVPEPGGKARIVTTTLWWVIVLSQPAGHFLKDTLLAHPSAAAGLQRADQAWLYIDHLAMADMTTSPEPVWFLSSDLSEATDAIPPAVARALVEGYCEGLGANNPLLKMALDIATASRYVEPDKGDAFIKKRGVLMGEAMTKSILCLLNLCVEEAAIRDYLETPDGPITAPWRSYSVGGDDHIAGGPRKYLDLITDNHRRWGSIISNEKHGVSRKAVRYCEKALWFEGTDYKIKARLVNISEDNYRNSVFVDSVKVRLLSPVSKSFEIENDRNIAIGKAKSFGRTLRWLNNIHFPVWWVKMVRNRFWSRMRDYLPQIDTPLYYHLLLPEAYGGLDLYLKGELEGAVKKCPLPTRQFIYKLISGLSDHKLVNRFKRFCSNDRMRGQDFASYLKRAVDEFDFDELGPIVALPALEPMTLWQARDKYKISRDLPLREVVFRLNTKGVYYSDQIVDLALRPTLFNEMLAGATTNVKWNTTPWKKRYAQLWDDVIDTELGDDFDLPDLDKIEKPEVFLPLKFYDVNTKDEEDEPSFKELIDDGLPSLRLRFWDTLNKRDF